MKKIYLSVSAILSFIVLLLLANFGFIQCSYAYEMEGTTVDTIFENGIKKTIVTKASNNFASEPLTVLK